MALAERQSTEGFRLRKRTFDLRGDDAEDFGSGVSPPSPARRRTLRTTTPSLSKESTPKYDDYSSSAEDEENNKQNESGPRLPTPPMTPTRTRASNRTPKSTTTGLTPALNRALNLINDPVVAVPKKTAGYSTPASLARAKSSAELGGANAKPGLSRTLSGSVSRAATTPSSSPSESTSVVTYYQEAKALFRRSTEPDQLVGRETERATIRTFITNHVLTFNNPGSLYMSGQPGTGKTALLKEVMRTMEPNFQAAGHEIKVVNINCMAVKDPKYVYQKMLEEMGYTASSTNATDKKDANMHALEALVLESSSTSSSNKKKKTLFVAILDEIDQLLTKDQEVLYKLFQWSTSKSSKLTLIGIANALDMTERLLPRLKAKGCEPQLMHFNPYQVKEIQEIIKARLCSLDSTNEVETGSSTTSVGLVRPRTVPLMDARAIEMCARKVAAGSGDLRKALDICRQSLELVESEAKKKERGCELAKLRRMPLQEISLAQANKASNVAESRATSPFSTASSSRASSPGAVFTNENTGAVLPDERDGITLIPITEAPKVTLQHIKKALEASSGTSSNKALKEVNFNQKVILALLVIKIQSGKTVDCQVGKLFESYTQICKTMNVPGFRPAVRSEFQDLLGMTESVGIVTLENKGSFGGRSKANQEERLRHVNLVPQCEDVLAAIREKDHHINGLLLKHGL
ncbi:AAA ATPase [Gryganskiella cystojenkinii]|nr:AAA ATPase [Gryganskiella cystojenkinii]